MSFIECRASFTGRSLDQASHQLVLQGGVLLDRRGKATLCMVEPWVSFSCVACGRWMSRARLPERFLAIIWQNTSSQIGLVWSVLH